MLVFLLFFSLLSSIDSQNNFCPPGYNNLTSSSGATFCYQVYAPLNDHSSAETLCLKDNGSLVQITDTKFNSIIVAAANSITMVHIGVKCYDTNLCFYNNGIRVTNMLSNFISPPAAKTEGCVVMDAFHSGTFYGKWLSVDCSTAAGYVCQQAPIVSIQTTVNTNCGYPYILDVRKGNYPIISPNYPYDYDNNIHCSYAFIGGPFNFTFSSFNIEPNDTMKFYGGVDPSTVPTSGLSYVTRLNGKYDQVSFTIPNYYVLVVFTTNDNLVYPGFTGFVTKA